MARQHDVISPVDFREIDYVVWVDDERGEYRALRRENGRFALDRRDRFIIDVKRGPTRLLRYRVPA